jgi:hypothetical protein
VLKDYLEQTELMERLVRQVLKDHKELLVQQVLKDYLEQTELMAPLVQRVLRGFKEFKGSKEFKVQ